MRRLCLLLLVALTACVPVVQPGVTRDGPEVVITAEATRDLFDVTLSVRNATSADERCVTLNITDLGCVIGDVSEGEGVSVAARGEVGAVTCVMFGFINERRSAIDYRVFPCAAGEGG